MNEVLPSIEDVDEIPTRFDEYWDEQQKLAINEMVVQEGLIHEKLNFVLQDYIFTNRPPLREHVVGMLENKPRLLERRSITEKVMERLNNFVEVFVNNM